MLNAHGTSHPKFRSKCPRESLDTSRLDIQDFTSKTFSCRSFETEWVSATEVDTRPGVDIALQMQRKPVLSCVDASFFASTFFVGGVLSEAVLCSAC